MTVSIASVASQQNGTTAATGTGTTSTKTAGTSDPLASLSSNFGSFLSLLMTQLKNQDPTSPLDTNQFTSELVQFSSVEQQISTNSSLSQLIQLTQAGDVVQSSSMVGKSVTVDADHVPLQNGTGRVNFIAPSAEPVTISIADASGNGLRTVTLNATQGANRWTWDGTDDFGSAVADGSYKVSVTSAATGTGSSAGKAVPFTVTGTATGVQKSGTTLNLQLGGLSTDFANVESVGN